MTLSLCRGAEILYSLALAHARRASADGRYPLSDYALLSNARRNLGLFQHHDAITGTAKEAVAVDYGVRCVWGPGCPQGLSQSGAGGLRAGRMARYGDPVGRSFLSWGDGGGCWGNAVTDGGDGPRWLTLPLPQVAPLPHQPQACHQQCCALPRAGGQGHIPPRPGCTVPWHGEQHQPLAPCTLARCPYSPRSNSVLQRPGKGPQLVPVSLGTAGRGIGHTSTLYYSSPG